MLFDAKESDVDDNDAAVTGHLVDSSGVLSSAIQKTEFGEFRSTSYLARY